MIISVMMSLNESLLVTMPPLQSKLVAINSKFILNYYSVLLGIHPS